MWGGGGGFLCSKEGKGGLLEKRKVPCPGGGQVPKQRKVLPLEYKRVPSPRGTEKEVLAIQILTKRQIRREKGIREKESGPRMDRRKGRNAGRCWGTRIRDEKPAGSGEFLKKAIVRKRKR